MITFIVEKNLFYAADQESYIEAIRRSGNKVYFVDYIPFSQEIIPLPSNTSNCIALGSTNMMRAILKSPNKHWVFSTERVTLPDMFHRWNDIMLNSDGYMTTLGKLSIDNRMFVRPMDDLKSFAGQVVDSSKLKEWKEFVKNYSMMADEHLVNDDTCVWVAPIKQIDAEYRLFVVAKTVVTGCRYRKNDVLEYVAELPDRVLQFVQKEIYQQKNLPDAYVLDVAVVNGELKIIEINCINSAGVYACNADSIINALANIVSY